MLNKARMHGFPLMRNEMVIKKENVFGQACFSLLLLVILLFLIPTGLNAQESILSSYERNFIRASLAGKTGILRDAALDDSARNFIGVLYELALQFALSNSQFLCDDPDMLALVSTAARGAGTGGNPASVITLWELFRVYQDSYSRVEIIGALALLGKGDQEIIGNLNRLLYDNNDLFRRGENPDLPVLRACIAALGVLGDGSSFPVLFSTMTAPYPQVIAQEALKSLEAVRGDFFDFLIGVIRKNSLPEKAAAFSLGASNEKLTPEERGGLAMAALEVSMEQSGPAERTLRYDAITVLTRLGWTLASPLAIRNFYQVQTDYANGAVERNRLLEAIACLAVMRTTEAAHALALQLGYYNAQTEKTGSYDEAVILSLINALGELGDKAAFDCLLYIGYLNYPDKIQASAREALNRLKW
jgi:hypothetical protein